MGKPALGRGKGHILALDVGTSALHCLLADPLGSPIATASAPMCYFRPDGCSLLTREFDPQSILSTLGQLTVEVLKRGGVKARDVSAIGITSQRQGVVFLDGEGNEIYSGPNVDLRAIFEGAAMDEELGQEIYATTGHFPSFLLAPARLRWLRENRPSIYSKTHAILTVAGWLSYRLTGSLLSEPALEGEAGLLDIRTWERPAALLESLGVPLSLLPPLPQESLPRGALSRPMAALWGLSAGIPVFLVGPDTQCGLLGMGLVKEGQAGAVMGWSGAMQVLTSRPCQDEKMRTWVGLYPFDCVGDTPSGPGLSQPRSSRPPESLWVAESNLGDAGNAYRWLKDILLGSDASFEEAERLALEASASPDFDDQAVSAFLGPGPVSPSRSGLRMGGLLFSTPLSFQEATRGQLFRAALENIAYSLKANLTTLREVTGLDIQTLHLGGGMASSRTLAATLATVLGFPIKRSVTPQVSARGAALAVAVWVKNPSLTPSAALRTGPSAWLRASLEQAAESAAKDCEEVEPGTASQIAQYQESYQRWLHLYKRLELE